MPLPAKDDYHQHLHRAQIGREAYIEWLMQDLPLVYRNLMPVTCKVRELFEAERAIRAQYEEDQKLAKSPWHPIGQNCMSLLDFTDFEPGAPDYGAFAMSTRVPQGLPARPKPGRYPEAMEDLKKRVVPGIEEYCERMRISENGKFLDFDNEEKDLPKHSPG